VFILAVMAGVMAQTGGKVGGAATGVKLYCVDLIPTPFCEDTQTKRTTMPEKVCSTTNSPVTSAKSWDALKFQSMANATCPKSPGLYNKKDFCQTPFLPCTAGLSCPTTTKLCYSLCLNGGSVGNGEGHNFLSPAQCQEGTAAAFCEKRKADGEVASLEETTAGQCVGLSYYNLYYTMAMLAQSPFQPRACRARFPIFNKNMVEFNADMRVDFMKGLAKKLNRIWGYANNSKSHKWHRPVNIRLRRVQLMKGVIQVFAELKEFCMTELRTGTPDYTLKYNQDQYCDDVSVSPDDVYANLTALLDTKKPDRGMQIADTFQILKKSEPGWPTYCYTWQPEEKPKIPGWVWMLTAIGAMCCLLSVLVLQHRYRNRASYVRLNEKLRSYV